MVVVKIVRARFSEERLIAYAVRTVERLSGATLTVGRADIDFAGELTFRDVSIRVPNDKLRADGPFNADDTKLLDAHSLTITFRRAGVFGHRIKLQAITIDQPTVSLARATDIGKWNWQLLFADATTQPTATAPTFAVGPELHIRNGTVNLHEIVAGERLLRGTLYFAADALPTKTSYRIDVDTWTRADAGPHVTMEFDPRTGQVLSGAIPSIDWRNIELTIPQPYRDWCRKFELAGKLGMIDAQTGSTGARTTLVLENVSARVPLSAQESQHPDRPWFVTLQQLNGRIVFEKDRATIERMTGMLNGAPCQVSGFTTLAGSATQLGYDLSIKTTNLHLPDYTQPDVREKVDRDAPAAMQKLLYAFRPIGPIDAEVAFRKRADSTAPAEYNGVIRLRKTSLEYWRFPYRVDNLEGDLELIDGEFHLKQLKAVMGKNVVDVNGRVSSLAPESEVDLDIRCSHLPLDDKLYAPLSDRLKGIWRSFGPSGAAKTRIQLFCPAGKDQIYHRRLGPQNQRWQLRRSRGNTKEDYNGPCCCRGKGNLFRKKTDRCGLEGHRHAGDRPGKASRISPA